MATSQSLERMKILVSTVAVVIVASAGLLFLLGPAGDRGTFIPVASPDGVAGVGVEPAIEGVGSRSTEGRSSAGESAGSAVQVSTGEPVRPSRSVQVHVPSATRRGTGAQVDTRVAFFSQIPGRQAVEVEGRLEGDGVYRVRADSFDGSLLVRREVEAVSYLASPLPLAAESSTFEVGALQVGLPSTLDVEAVDADGRPVPGAAVILEPAGYPATMGAFEPAGRPTLGLTTGAAGRARAAAHRGRVKLSVVSQEGQVEVRDLVVATARQDVLVEFAAVELGRVVFPAAVGGALGDRFRLGTAAAVIASYDNRTGRGFLVGEPTLDMVIEEFAQSGSTYTFQRVGASWPWLVAESQEEVRMVAAYDASSSLYHQWQRADRRLQIEVRPEGRLADQFRWPVKGQATWADGVRVWTQRLSSNGRELIAESLPVFGRDCAVSLELVDAGGATWKGDVQLTAVGAGVARVAQGGPVEQCWVQILDMESNRPLTGARVRARRVGPASGNAPFAVVDEEGVASVGEASGVLGIEVLLGASGIASRQGLQEGTEERVGGRTVRTFRLSENVGALEVTWEALPTISHCDSMRLSLLPLPAFSSGASVIGVKEEQASKWEVMVDVVPLSAGRRLLEGIPLGDYAVLAVPCLNQEGATLTIHSSGRSDGPFRRREVSVVNDSTVRIDLGSLVQESRWPFKVLVSGPGELKGVDAVLLQALGPDDSIVLQSPERPSIPCVEVGSGSWSAGEVSGGAYLVTIMASDGVDSLRRIDVAGPDRSELEVQRTGTIRLTARGGGAPPSSVEMRPFLSGVVAAGRSGGSGWRRVDFNQDQEGRMIIRGVIPGCEYEVLIRYPNRSVQRRIGVEDWAEAWQDPASPAKRVDVVFAAR